MRIIVTGAAGALGRVVTRKLAEDGWSVLAVDRAETGFAEHERIQPVGGADLIDGEATAALAQRLKAQGEIAGLVNIAGGFIWETMLDGDPASWDKMFALNLKTAMNACRAFAPDMPDGRGAIVNIGAAGALKAGMGMGSYAASKAGVHRLTEALAEELKPRRIRVNAVLPSIIDTPANRADMPDADPSDWVTAEELAAVIAFLVSEQASGVTGALIPVTGRV